MSHESAAHDIPRSAPYELRTQLTPEPSYSGVALFLVTGCEEPATMADLAERPTMVPSGLTGAWVTTAMTSREPSSVTMTLEQSGRLVRGTLHLGPPAFDVTLVLSGAIDRHGRLVAKIGSGDALVGFAGELYDDGTALAGPVSYAGRVLFTLELQRR